MLFSEIYYEHYKISMSIYPVGYEDIIGLECGNYTLEWVNYWVSYMVNYMVGSVI